MVSRYSGIREAPSDPRLSADIRDAPAWINGQVWTIRGGMSPRDQKGNT